MATYPLHVDSQPAARRWRGVVRFVAWLTIFGAGTLIAAYFMASRQLVLPHGTGAAHAIRYEPFLLLRKLIARLSGAHFNTIWFLFAPLVIAALCALFSLGGPHWRRIMLALLSLLVAGFNLFACLSLVWALSWNGAAAGVIGAAYYVALSVSLMSVVMAFGFLFMALASAWRWPLLNARGARIVAGWWAAFVASGAGLLNASYFMVWGSWRSPGAPGSGERIIPIGLYFSGQSAGQLSMLLLLFAPPVVAALCAFLTLGAPRWRRVTLALLGLLAGMSSLVVSLTLLGLLFVRDSGYGVLTRGGVIGLGASIVIVVAMFGLLSVPHPLLRRAPATRLLAESQTLRAA